LCDPAYLGPTLCTNAQAVAAALSSYQVLIAAEGFVNNTNILLGPQDLFWAVEASHYREIEYFFPYTSLIEAVGAYLELAFPALENSTALYQPIGSLGMRVFTPQGTSPWEYLPTGSPVLQLELTHLVFDFLTFDQVTAIGDFFTKLEAAWLGVGGKPHMGKCWGYGNQSTWLQGQHNDEFLGPYNFYTSTAQTNQLASLIVPTFASGSQLFTLMPSSFVPFEPRGLNGNACPDPTDNSTCISNYCAAGTCSDIPTPSPSPSPAPSPSPSPSPTPTPTTPQPTPSPTSANLVRMSFVCFVLPLLVALLN